MRFSHQTAESPTMRAGASRPGSTVREATTTRGHKQRGVEARAGEPHQSRHLLLRRGRGWVEPSSRATRQ